MYLLDQASLDGKELRHDATVRGGCALALLTILEAEADHRQHDAAFLVHDRISPVPQVAADEAAGIEPGGGRDVGAVADEASGLKPVLEALRVRQQICRMVVGGAVGLERAPVAFRYGDQAVVRVPLGFANRQLQRWRDA